jgi:hypothetical protein
MMVTFGRATLAASPAVFAFKMSRRIPFSVRDRVRYLAAQTGAMNEAIDFAVVREEPAR